MRFRADPQASSAFSVVDALRGCLTAPLPGGAACSVPTSPKAATAMTIECVMNFMVLAVWIVHSELPKRVHCLIHPWIQHPSG